MGGLGNDLVNLGLLGVAGVAIGLAVAGVRNKVVVYYDTADLGISALALLAPLAFLALASVQPFVTPFLRAAWTFGLESLAWSSGAYFLVLNVANAIRYNRSLPLGLLVGALKLAYLVLCLGMVFALLQDTKPRRRSGTEVLLGWLAVLGLLLLGRALVNGERVYQEKGWPLPRPKAHFWRFT